MAVKLSKTNTPGIYRTHANDCNGGRCDCPMSSYGGTVDDSTPRRSRPRRGSGGEGEPGRWRHATGEPGAVRRLRAAVARQLPGPHGSRAAERTRRLYRRDMEQWAIPYFRGRRLEEVEPPDVRAFVRHLERKGLRPASIRSILPR